MQFYADYSESRHLLRNVPLLCFLIAEEFQEFNFLQSNEHREEFSR